MSDFDPDELRPLIIANNGNVKAIADEIGADSETLRRFIQNTPILAHAMIEVIARGVDQSVSVLFKGLDDDEHFGSQLAAAKEFLKSRPAQRRGFHHAGDLELKMPAKGGALTLTWLPPGEERPEPPLIEGTVEDAK
jgi:hypothetical protein